MLRLRYRLPHDDLRQRLPGRAGIRSPAWASVLSS